MFNCVLFLYSLHEINLAMVFIVMASILLVFENELVLRGLWFSTFYPFPTLEFWLLLIKYIEWGNELAYTIIPYNKNCCHLNCFILYNSMSHVNSKVYVLLIIYSYGSFANLIIIYIYMGVMIDCCVS